MTVNEAKQFTEDIFTEAGIPINEYKLELVKSNGNIAIEIYPRNSINIPHMFLFSEVIGGYTQMWTCEFKKGSIHIIIS